MPLAHPSIPGAGSNPFGDEIDLEELASGVAESIAGMAAVATVAGVSPVSGDVPAESLVPTLGAWRLQKRSNLAAYDAWDFLADGSNVSRDGLDWTAINGATYSTVLGFDGSTGLRIDPANGSNLHPVVDTAPSVVAKIAQLCSEWRPHMDAVSIVARLSVSPPPAANYDGAGLAIQVAGSAPSPMFVRGGPLYSGSSLSAVNCTGSSGELTAAAAAAANCVEQTYYPNGVVRTRVGVYPWSGTPSSVYPTPGSDAGWTAVHVDGYSMQSLGKPTASTPVLWASTSGSRFDLTTAFLRLFAFEVSSPTGIVATFSEVFGWLRRA